MNSCDACTKPIKANEQLTCSKCGRFFHHLCQNITLAKFKKLSPDARVAWTCSSCARARSTSIDETPVGPNCSTNNVVPRRLPNTNGDILEVIRSEIRSSLRSELRSLFEKEMAPIKLQLADLQKSAEYMSGAHDDLMAKLSSLTHDNKQLQTDCYSLQETVNRLTNNINMLEQHLRETNIEIHGVPEHKAENVVNVLQQLSNVVSHKLEDTDILNCVRVARMDRDNKKPRTIVAKLRSTRCRDDFYSAVTRYNKSHPDDKLNSALLGIAGKRTPIFIAEHLSPANKALHQAARAKAKELSYKFVWVRGGRIFVRKTDTSRILVIHNKQSLDNLKD